MLRSFSLLKNRRRCGAKNPNQLFSFSFSEDKGSFTVKPRNIQNANQNKYSNVKDKSFNTPRNPNEASMLLAKNKEIQQKLRRAEKEHAFLVTDQPIVINEKNEVLVFYNDMKLSSRVISLMKFIVPLGVLAYLIKKNPFYISYPVMLPIMSFAFCGFLFLFLNQLKRHQHIIKEIWLDKSGNEVRVVYNNAYYRSVRRKNVEDIMLNSSLLNPNFNVFNVATGDLYPNNFPFIEENVVNGSFGLCWRKYYITSRNYMMIPKNPILNNFELLHHIFLGKRIKLSEATNIYRIDFEGTEQKELKKQLKEIFRIYNDAAFAEYMKANEPVKKVEVPAPDEGVQPNQSKTDTPKEAKQKQPQNTNQEQSKTTTKSA